MSITVQEFEKRLEASSGAFQTLVRRTLQTTVLKAEAKAKLRVTGGSPLHTRSGRLRSSIKAGLRGQATGGPQAVVEGFLRAGGTTAGGQVKYARIHELGGDIVPKNAKFLAIPTGAQKTASGVSRGGPRQTPGLAFVQGGSGPALVNTATGAAHFLLRRHVRIPARPYLRPSMKEAAAQLPSSLAPLLARSLKADI